MGGRRREMGFVLTCHISRYVSELGISFVQAACHGATVTAGIGSGGMLARVTAALGGMDLATVIRSHNGEERLLEHSLL